jgi:7,8-dihydro-6-hydroxymethylpterin dimethyltransferase
MNESSGGAVLSETESLCPACLKKIPAWRVASGEDIYLEKRCAQHGFFRTIIWRGKPALSNWTRPKVPVFPVPGITEKRLGCPLDCGLCPDHRQRTCTALIEVTGHCHLNCPICFASSGSAVGPDPDLEQIGRGYERIREVAGPCHIQLSGGEPSVRDDLPAIVTLGRRLGFDFIQLNTNGRRLAQDADYARTLKEAGLSSVFLQFDGMSPEGHRALRGRPLGEEKQLAVERCGRAGLGVVLVPTVVPGVNERELGAILQFALEQFPTVRGLHLQPISYFGRYPVPPEDSRRITIPEILAALEAQSAGRVRAADFRPSACEHALCSFHGNFLVLAGNRLQPLGGTAADECCGESQPVEGGARRTIAAVSRQWSAPPTVGVDPPGGEVFDLSDFLDHVRHYRFSISGMAFQDVWNLDLERLQGCCIHTLAPDGRLIPFCAYNLTDSRGLALYRGRA